MKVRIWPKTEEPVLPVNRRAVFDCGECGSPSWGKHARGAAELCSDCWGEKRSREAIRAFNEFVDACYPAGEWS
jgi:hypothetical protein